MAGKEKENRKLLLAERKRLAAEIERLSNSLEDSQGLGYGNHMADDASAVFEQATGAGLRQDLQERLEEIDAALDRVQRGTYGRCESCGREIDVERLQILPAARLCVECSQRKKHPHSFVRPDSST